jgi:hypothetical protein
VHLLDAPDNGLSETAAALRVELNTRITEWHAAENARLASAQLSDAQVDALRNAIAAPLKAGQRLTDAIPRADALSSDMDVSPQPLERSSLLRGTMSLTTLSISSMPIRLR